MAQSYNTYRPLTPSRTESISSSTSSHTLQDALRSPTRVSPPNRGGAPHGGDMSAYQTEAWVAQGGSLDPAMYGTVATDPSLVAASTHAAHPGQDFLPANQPGAALPRQAHQTAPVPACEYQRLHHQEAPRSDKTNLSVTRAPEDSNKQSSSFCRAWFILKSSRSRLVLSM